MATQESVNIELEPQRCKAGEDVNLKATGSSRATYNWSVTMAPTPADKEKANAGIVGRDKQAATLATAGLQAGEYEIHVARTDKVNQAGVTTESKRGLTIESAVEPVEGIRRAVEMVAESGLPIKLREPVPTADQALWSRMRACLDGRSFERYRDFIDRVLCEKNRPRDDCGRLAISGAECCYTHGVHGYDLLKAATEVYLLCHACCGELPHGTNQRNPEFAGFDPEAEKARLGYTATRSDMQARLTKYLESSVTPGTLPYLGQIIKNLDLERNPKEGAQPPAFPFCEGSVRDQPCLFELIWSYWHEEGMLVQTLNAISLRFQNRRVKPAGQDPLANFELNPLRPLNNLLWGYIQDEDRRLTVRRRTYEYEHHYGLRLVGKAVGDLAVAERRSKFLEAFHSLLHRASAFYKDEQNLMMKPDAFPLLEAIRAVHLLLAEGAHNQFGDLPSTARGEMLIQQWLLAQPPMRDFLQSRAMVPYDEPWMGSVDAMKKLMGWTDATVIHFHKLAVFGEKILLSIRFGNWNSVVTTAEQAENWVRYWRPEVQGYIESYRTVSGIDLSAAVRTINRVDATLPAVLIERRLNRQSAAAK